MSILKQLPKNENLQLFDIEFDNVTGLVYAGQEIRGRVVVMLGELMTIRGVRLRLIGRSHTSWADDRYYQLPVHERAMEHVICNAEEIFFDTTLTLYGYPPYEPGASRKSNRRREALHEGVYEFPFRYEIPVNCPTTFEGDHGYIRYVCCAIVATPWKHDRMAKRAFTVIQSGDLNSLILPEYGSVNEPVENETSIVLNQGCCSRKQGEIAMRVCVPKSGYVCGECIPIWANIANNSGQRIKKIKATLLQRVRYRSKYRNSAYRDKIMYRTIAEVSTKEELGAHWALIWDKERINVPPITPTIDSISELIHVDYALVYEASSMNVALPIYIGTIPMMASVRQLRKNYKSDFTDLTPSKLPADLLPLPPEWKNYIGMLPPCFCKDDRLGPVTIRERADTEFVPGQLSYEPRYPYYAWPPKDFTITDDDSNLSVSVFQ